MRQLTLWDEGPLLETGAAFFSRKKENRDYEAFVEKFKPMKATDDCYTPENVYDAVAGWVENEYRVNRDSFVRPFYPGGDYERYEYPAGCVVVDNPPFSILAAIIRFYVESGVKFFLFAPTLTLFSSSASRCCSIGVGVQVTYENGANVSTSFTTNLETTRLRSAPSLYQAVKAVNDANLKEQRKELPKYEYPAHVLTATKLAWFSKYGVEFRAGPNETFKIDALDGQKRHGKSIFGDGYLLSEAKADERLLAEKLASEKAAARKWTLSERERHLVRRLDEKKATRCMTRWQGSEANRDGLHHER